MKITLIILVLLRYHVFNFDTTSTEYRDIDIKKVRKMRTFWHWRLKIKRSCFFTNVHLN